MVWLIIPVNLSTSTGHDSLNLTAWEIKREPNAKMTRKVSNKVIAIATTLFIRILTKKSTNGLSRIAIIVAKTSGNNNVLCDVQYCKQGNSAN